MSQKFFPHRTERQRALDDNIVHVMAKFFPNLRPQKMADPARSSIMAAISNLGTYAFGAYEVPTVIGFTEHTTDNNTIKHLKWDWMNNAMEGVFKITAQNAKNLRDSDGIIGRKSDPYVIFSSGGSLVQTEPIYDNLNPEWNSTHYLCLRKRALEPEDANTLVISVFDKDVRTGAGAIGAIANWFDRDDFLGSVTLQLADLKKPGIHSIEHELENPRFKPKSPATISFTVEYMSVAKAFAQMDMDSNSAKWLARDPTLDVRQSWSELALMTDVGHVSVEPVAYVEAPSTDTQAWVHVNIQAKVVCVAFRGTETNKLQDVLADLNAIPSALTVNMSSDKYAMKPTPEYLDTDIRLHAGFMRAYNSIRESILRVIYDLTGWEEKWTVCITGHSLGGALATICAFECANRRFTPPLTAWQNAKAYMGMTNQEKKLAPKVGMMNFGAPRVGNGKFVEVYNETVKESLRVINANDLVHFLPYFLYSHTKFEVLLRENGEVGIQGMTVQAGDYGEEINEMLAAGEVKEEDIREKAFKMISVQKHLQPYYFDIVKSAVTKFFHTDISIRGHPLRVLRARGIGIKPQPQNPPPPATTTPTTPEQSKTPAVAPA